METLTVSQEVKLAASEYARANSIDFSDSVMLYDAFIAGAYFQKPIEHTQLPNPKDNGNVLGE